MSNAYTVTKLIETLAELPGDLPVYVLEFGAGQAYEIDTVEATTDEDASTRYVVVGFDMAD